MEVIIIIFLMQLGLVYGKLLFAPNEGLVQIFIHFEHEFCRVESFTQV